MKILVTGGAGYVGSVVTSRLLAAGYEVCVYDNLLHGGSSLLNHWSNTEFEFIQGDVRDETELKKAVRECYAVIHLAAIVGDPACAADPSTAVEVNKDSSIRLIEICKSEQVPRFIFASTCSNYGRMKNSDGSVDEISELHPISLYAETKVAVEDVILDSPQLGFSPTLLRFATVFGVSPRMRFDLTVNEFTAELLTKKLLTVYGSQFWRPYVHVTDVARAVELILKAPSELVSNDVFNVGSTEQNYQKQGIVDLVLSKVPDGKVEYVHRQEDPRDYRVSFEKIRQNLGFVTNVSVERGIEEVAALIKSGVIQDHTNAKYYN